MADEFDDIEAKFGGPKQKSEFDAIEEQFGASPEPIPPAAPGAFNVPMDAFYAGLPRRGGVAVVPGAGSDPVAERGRVVMEEDRVEAERAAARREVIQQFQQDWVESGRSADEYLAKYDPDNRPEDFDLMLQHAEAKATAAETEFQQRKGELAFRDVTGAAGNMATGFDFAAAGSSPELMARSREDASPLRWIATKVLGIGGAVIPISRLRSALAVLGRTGSLSGAMAVHSGATTAVGTGDAGEAGMAAVRGGIQGLVVGAVPVPMPRTGSATVNLAGAAAGEGLSNVAGYGLSEVLTGGEVTGRGAAEQFILGALLGGTGRMGEASREAGVARVGLGREAVRQRRVAESTAEAVRVADEVRAESQAREAAQARSVEEAQVGRPLPPITDAEGREIRMGGEPGGRYSTMPLTPEAPLPQYDPMLAPGGVASKGRPGVGVGAEPRGPYSTAPLTPEAPIPEYDPLLAPGGLSARTGRGGGGGGGMGRGMATDPLIPTAPDARVSGDPLVPAPTAGDEAARALFDQEPLATPERPPDVGMARGPIAAPEAVSGRPVASGAEPTAEPAPAARPPAAAGTAAGPVRPVDVPESDWGSPNALYSHINRVRQAEMRARRDGDLARADALRRQHLEILARQSELIGAPTLQFDQNEPAAEAPAKPTRGMGAKRKKAEKAADVSPPAPEADPAPYRKGETPGMALPEGTLTRQPGESVPAWQARVAAAKADRARRMGGLASDPEAGYVGLGRPGIAAPNGPSSPGWWSRLYGQLAVPAQRLFGQTFKAVEGQAGGVGDEVVGLGQRALTEAAIYRSDVADSATEARRASSGGFGVQSATKANAGAQTVAVEGTASAISRFRELIERDAAPRNAAEARLKAAWQRLLADTWNAQVQRGFQRKNKAGAEEPMRRIEDGKGRVLPYMGNERLSEILDTGETHPDFQPLLEAVQELNPGRSIDSLKEHLLQRRKSAETGMVGSEGHMASEFSRSVIMPDFIKVNGGWVPVMEVNPSKAVDALVSRGSHTVGADMAFGRLSKSKVKDLRDRYIKGGGSVDDFNSAMRSLYGMSPTPNRVRFAPMDTPLGAIKAGYNALAGLSRALTQTGSAAWNAAEFLFGNATLFNGMGNQILGTMDAVADGLSRLAGRGHTPAVRGLIDLGIKTENVADKSRDIHAAKAIDATNRFSRALTEIFSRPIEEGQETAAGSAAVRKMRSVLSRVGEFSDYRRERLAGQLQVYADLTKQEAVDFLEGTLPQAQQDAMLRRILERVVPATTASNLAPAQRSRFEHSPWTRMAVKFYRWASNNLRTSAKTLDVGAKGLLGKDSSLAQRGASAAMLGEFAAMKAIQGGAANLLVAMMLGKDGALDEEMKRLADDPAGYFALAAFSNAVAGPVGSLAQGVFRGSVNPRMALPVQLAQDFIIPPLKAAKSAATGEFREAALELGAAAERAIPPLRGFSGGQFGERQRKEKRGMGRGR